MPKTIATRHAKRAAARRRAIRRRAAGWKRQARRAITAALILANGLGGSGDAFAQGVAGQGLAAGFGQTAMTPSGGLVNSAVARFQDLNANGPGWLYYGANAADRGLGYRGSYMTLGGYIPYAEDDLGGLWAADVRSHLSNYGGFFSNVGAVRKQFLGGTLLGLGVYWDYDGDQNQYSDTTITDDSGSYVFAGGQSYNQVGVSGEWLTDYGNLRSNGYIPVGSYGQVMGPFVGNSLLCTNGINAALSGADLEVGAYIPGLSDWAGMVSVGGYAYGNTSYKLANGQASVPWFGGVYTRLDVTLVKNWDFSLQYNNDSYFDSTGFARLTYRMGGSRRRNVPDQMEQPMMRNEHIVRAHQAPEQALNPLNSNTAWKFIHVDNSKTDAPSGNGTAENPYTTLAQAQAAAGAAYDVVFVHQGNSANSPYTGGFTFQQDHQYLIGQGSAIQLPTVDCGYLSLAKLDGHTGAYPVLSSPSGTAVTLDKLNPTVDHIQIVGSAVGIGDGPGLPAASVATVNDVRIIGTGPSQTGVVLAGGANGATLNFTNMVLSGLTADGFVVDGQGSGGTNAQVNILNSSISNTAGTALVVNDMVGDGRVRLSNSTIDGATGPGVQVTGGNAIVESSKIENVGLAGVSVTAPPIVSGSALATGTSVVQVVSSTITAPIGVLATANDAGQLVNITINQNALNAPAGGNGIQLAVNQTGTTGPGVINANIVGNKITVAPTTTFTGTTTTLTKTDIYLISGTTTTGTSLTIKAADKENLSALNNSAIIKDSPTSPPTYNPAVVVPVPAY
ncbi:MAG: hypothetical protein EBZ74_06065 [Planctomycetia bacterium]|nr:hypothetical protein [Planctomycetia bacterium]